MIILRKESNAAFSILMIMAWGCSGTQISDVETIHTPATQSEETGSPEQADSLEGFTYRLEVGDIFEVKVYNHQNLSESLVVRPDGKVSLLLAEEIQAAGLTPAELDSVLTEIYCERIHNPELAIILRKFAGNRVYVGGEVIDPKELWIEGRLTLLQAIYKAGGFKESAKINSVVLLRDRDSDTPEVKLVDVKKVLSQGVGDIVLYPYDAVFVPKTFIAKADKFVDQYINKIVPRNLSAGFAWTYNLTPWIEVFNRD